MLLKQHKTLDHTPANVAIIILPSATHVKPSICREYPEIQEQVYPYTSLELSTHS